MHCAKAKESMNRLIKILITVRQILKNLNNGATEDGNPMELSETDRNESIQLWTDRQRRVQHSIVNCALQQEVNSKILRLIKSEILNSFKLIKEN